MKLSLFLLLYAASFSIAWAQNSHSFDPKKDGLPFTNFGDMTMEGYCQGFSNYQCFKRVSKEDLKKAFGEKVAHWMWNDQVENDVSARLKLLRLYAMLQMNEAYAACNAAQPRLSNFGRFANGRKVSSEQAQAERKTSHPGSTSSQQALHGPEAVEKYYKFLNSEVGQETGLIVSVSLHKPPQTGLTSTFFEAGHALYAYKATFKSGVYTFYFLDPNHPQAVNSFSYNAKTKETKFSNNPKGMIWLLESLARPDEELECSRKGIENLRTNKEPTMRAFATFLGVNPHPSDEEKIFDGHAFTDSDFAKLKQVTNRLLTPEALGAELRSDITAEEYNRLGALVGQAAAMLQWAGQAQLDAGCESYRKLLTRALADTARNPVSPKLPRPLSQDEYRSTTLLSYASSMALMYSVDGARKGDQFDENARQINCLQNLLTSLYSDKDSPLVTHPESFWAFRDQREQPDSFTWFFVQPNPSATLVKNVALSASPADVLEFYVGSSMPPALEGRALKLVQAALDADAADALSGTRLASRLNSAQRVAENILNQHFYLPIISAPHKTFLRSYLKTWAEKDKDGLVKRALKKLN